MPGQALTWRARRQTLLDAYTAYLKTCTEFLDGLSDFVVSSRKWLHLT